MLSVTSFIDAVRTSLIPSIIDCEINEERIDQNQNGGVSYEAYPMNPNPAHSVDFFEATADGVDGLMTSGKIIWGDYYVQIQVKNSNITAFINKGARESAQAEEFSNLNELFKRLANQLQIE
jgi:hypothetical protein